MSRPFVLQAALALNAAATAAAAVVLFVAPAAIPATVGMPLQRPQFFLAYLLAGAELGLSVMAAQALNGSRQAVRMAVMSLCAMHTASGLGGLVAVGQGASPLIVWNVLARTAIVALLLGGWVAADRMPGSTGDGAIGNSCGPKIRR